MTSRGGTIYAIGAHGTPLVKIGCTTTTVASRLKGLQTGQPFLLDLVAAVNVESDVQRIERQVHAFLEAQRRRGEWFEVVMDEATLQALIVRAIQSLVAEAQKGEDSPLDMRQFGRRLRAARRAAQLSQAELGERMRANRSWISGLETDQQTTLSAATLVRCAEALGVCTDYLLGLTDDPTPRRRRRPDTEDA